jgi:hypothetical protein
MRQNLYTGKIVLSNSAKYRVFYMKMGRIFQQCTNCCKKQDYLTALDQKFDMKTMIFLKID